MQNFDSLPLPPEWKKALADLTDIPSSLSDVLPEFCFFREKAEQACLPDTALVHLESVYKTLAAHQGGARFFNLLHYALFEAEKPLNLPALPELDSLFGADSGAFNLLETLSALPIIENLYKQVGFPPERFADAARAVGSKVPIYQLGHNNTPGLLPGSVLWIRNFIDGIILRVGRLEYQMNSRYNESFPLLFRRKKDGAITVLCRNKWHFDEAGRQLPESAENPFFTASLQMTDRTVTGVPISPWGVPLFDKRITLNTDEWDSFPRPHQKFPALHIPGGESLTLEKIHTSLTEAVRFFKDFLNMEIGGFTCSSWLLNPVWEKELPNSNMAKFLQNCYLTGILPQKDCGMLFIYGKPDANPLDEPCTNSLHQVLRRMYARGETPARGQMVLFASDLPCFGECFYRKSFRPDSGISFSSGTI